MSLPLTSVPLNLSSRALCACSILSTRTMSCLTFREATCGNHRSRQSIAGHTMAGGTPTRSAALPARTARATYIRGVVAHPASRLAPATPSNRPTLPLVLVAQVPPPARVVCHAICPVFHCLLVQSHCRPKTHCLLRESRVDPSVGASRPQAGPHAAVRESAAVESAVATLNAAEPQGGRCRANLREASCGPVG